MFITLLINILCEEQNSASGRHRDAEIKPLPSEAVSSRKVGKSDTSPTGQWGQRHTHFLPSSNSEMMSSPPEKNGSILHLLLIYLKSALSAKPLWIYSPTFCLWSFFFFCFFLFDFLFLQATLVAYTITPQKINSKHYPEYSPKFHHHLLFISVSCRLKLFRFMKPRKKPWWLHTKPQPPHPCVLFLLIIDGHECLSAYLGFQEELHPWLLFRFSFQPPSPPWVSWKSPPPSFSEWLTFWLYMTSSLPKTIQSVIMPSAPNAHSY